MKAIGFGLLLAISLLIWQCREEEPVLDPALTAVLQQLETPVTIRNDLAKGFLPGQCSRLILRDNDRNPVGVFTAVAHPKTHRVEWAEWQATGLVRGIRVGQQHRYQLYYRDDGLIDSVAYSRPGRGTEGSVTFLYQYENGVLKSVQAEDTYPFFYEWDFSYQPDGRVAKMFINHSPRSGASPRSFAEWSFTYDLTGNIAAIAVEEKGDDRIGMQYTYTYDTLPNPLQGLFAVQSLFKVVPFSVAIGPAFLSTNNVTSVVSLSKDGKREEESFVPFDESPSGARRFYSYSYVCR